MGGWKGDRDRQRQRQLVGEYRKREREIKVKGLTGIFGALILMGGWQG